MRVLFWGTPDFATPPLRALLGEGFDVVGVVTQPDRPVGRSRSALVAPPVKQVAIDEGIPVLQPDRPRGAEFIDSVRALDADISIVVAYGHILTRDVIDLPSRGTLNIHASLLPSLRGAAPIQAAILEGQRETGITIMRMVEPLDAGPIVHRVATPVADDETGGELSLRLSELGALALIEALALVSMGQAPETAQRDADATWAPKITRESTRIPWDAPASRIARMIRAYDPRPGAWCLHRGEPLKLFGGAVEAAGTRSTDAPGTVLDVSDLGLTVRCGDGAVRVAFAQPAGKARMEPVAWARGRGIAIGERLS